jgi:hypothetical protein
MLRKSLLALALGGALFVGCPGPHPPVDGGPAVTPSGWTFTARQALQTIRWAVPAAKLITNSLLSDPAKTQVARALDAVTDAARELQSAIDVYEQRGGEQCLANAAAGGVQRTLLGLARVLADNGIAIGNTLGGVVDSLGSVIDLLVPACPSDAGWSSAGQHANDELRTLGERRPLSPVLNDLHPADGGVQ